MSKPNIVGIPSLSRQLPSSTLFLEGGLIFPATHAGNYFGGFDR
jgi:hypothetical protein